jgi:hypothetical protein
MPFTLMRQIAAALAAWVVQWGAERGMQLDEGTIVALMLATFGLVAQGLKVITTRQGEIQPGGVSAATTDLEKARAGQL